MNLSDIKSLLNASVLTKKCVLDQDVHSAFSSDMMSNVLAYANNKSILITGLYNAQVLRTAEMMGMACVVFIGRREPDAQIIELADDLGICVMLTRFSMFTTCGKLYCSGLNGGVPSER
ncbi:MAG: DRTGG domain-containing protein [Lachnospiraceae bacterium]